MPAPHQPLTQTIDNPLFPNLRDRKSMDRYVGEALHKAMVQMPKRPVSSSVTQETYREDLSEMDFSRPIAFETVVDWTIGAMEGGMVHMTSPGYLGLFNPKPTFPAEIGDRIAAAFNPQACVWSHAPLPVEIEQHTIQAVARKAGMPEWSGGHFTSGGSEANHTAFLCALMRAEPDFADEGAVAFNGLPRIYISDESHLAWLKIARQCGVGRSAISRIPTDGQGRMDADILANAIQQDIQAGHVPVMIAATAGTTNAGMVDPLEQCLTLANEFGLWFHVDAAWGGALIASPRNASALSGIEHADSVTIDAHKWFASTMGAGMFLIRNPEFLPRVFNVSTSYMPSNDESIDPYVNSMQWSRRFIGIRLFMSLAIGGWDGFRDHIEHSITLIDKLTDQLTAKGWLHKNNSRMAIACFKPPAGGPSPQEIVDAIVAKGEHWISVAKFEGETVVRVCVTNYETDWKHLEHLIDAFHELTEQKVAV